MADSMTVFQDLARTWDWTHPLLLLQGQPPRRLQLPSVESRERPVARALISVPPVGQDRPRLAVIEGMNLTTTVDPYLNLRALAKYSGMSVRWLRDRLTDPHHPLPCYRLPSGKILVKRSDFDNWIARYRRLGDPDVDRIVNEALDGLR